LDIQPGISMNKPGEPHTALPPHPDGHGPPHQLLAQLRWLRHGRGPRPQPHAHPRGAQRSAQGRRVHGLREVQGGKGRASVCQAGPVGAGLQPWWWRAIPGCTSGEGAQVAPQDCSEARACAAHRPPHRPSLRRLGRLVAARRLLRLELPSNLLDQLRAAPDTQEHTHAHMSARHKTPHAPSRQAPACPDGPSLAPATSPSSPPLPRHFSPEPNLLFADVA
jgi:hypothetical protein